jgi:hypothetical protein
MKLGKFEIDIKNIVAVGSVLFAIISQVNGVKTDVMLLKKEIAEIKDEKIKDINVRMDEKIKDVVDDFSEYKIRNNGKIDDVSKKIYEINGQVQVCEKLGKKASRFMDAQVENMIRTQTCHCKK